MVALETNSVQKPVAKAAASAVRDVQRAVAEVIDSLPQAPQREPELRAKLQLNKKLSWSIFTLANSRETIIALSAIPGPRAFSRFLEAAERAGAAESSIRSASESLVRFEEVVSLYARGRQDFEAMVRSAESDAGSDSFAARHRLAAFRSNALLWGRQCKVATSTAIVAPSKGSDLIDRAFIRGVYGLHCTTPGLPLLSAMGTRYLSSPPPGAQHTAPTPIDPREREGATPGLMREFCSTPLPRYEFSIASDGRACHAFHPHALGIQSSVDLVFGHFALACGKRPRHPGGDDLVVSHSISRPTETFIRDVLIHEYLWDEQLPETRVYAPPMDGSADVHEIDRMPIRDSIEYLGQGHTDLRAAGIPNYPDVVAYAFDQLRWNIAEFRVFRSVVQYPVLHSWLRIVMHAR